MGESSGLFLKGIAEAREAICSRTDRQADGWRVMEAGGAQ
jgi:hypothetical protein